MKKTLLLLCLLITVTSCKSKKVYKTKKRPSQNTRTSVKTKASKQAITIVNAAKKFKGTPYKYGGNTKRGMDCSGLVHTSFKNNNLTVPRTTSQLKTHGKWVDLKKVKVGDLVFFATKKNSRTINHVGIITSARLGHVEFIHASSSKGVIISSLAEKYWYFAFVQARRVL